ncbi:hypothetical protein ISN44_As07g014210 [Arabidopsis suecica]|uniref:DUF674 family protein n=1 Tax=Arabidopsis suecica TaxID=45249 RepID=A0A8T2BT05_ARASU|nr:hypothetical protein ISN44_As07g014210 [Arabidopsis suecica]
MSKISLKILVDKEKNKIVLVEARKDFVDVLFGFLKLQMGTIVRLVKKQSQQASVGCFSNIYQSVLDLEIDNFLTKACKHMLLYPTGLNDDIFPRLKLNINDTTEAYKFSICTHCKEGTLRSSNRQKCTCGEMTEMGNYGIEMKMESDIVGYDVDGVFFYGQPSFIITDNMVVQYNSTDVFLKVIKDQGYADVEKLSESLLIIGFEEVLTLLDCVFTSDTPLTDAFLRKQSSRSRNMNKLHKTLTSPALQENSKATKSDLLTFNVVYRKQDKKVIYFEGCEDFVNLLFQFLVVSLEFVLETSGDNAVHGCIGNLFRSFKELSFAKNSKLVSKSTLPWYYCCEKKLLDINYSQSNLFFDLSIYTKPWILEKLKRPCQQCAKSNHIYACEGFVKGNMKFRVSDDLIITPLSSSSTIDYLKKLQVGLDDVDVQEITIGEVEVNNVLSTSLMTSTVLTTALWKLLVKEPKEES